MECTKIFLVLGCLISIIYAKVPQGYTRTPAGVYWSECVHQVPSGTEIISNGGGEPDQVIYLDGSVEYVKPCPVKSLGKMLGKQSAKGVGDAPNDGWQVWTAYNNENNATFDSFLGYFNVPNSPSSFQGEILYMFTGLQNDNWVPIPSEPNTPPGFDIIQPVLQYTSSGNWGLASWYVTVDENVYESTIQSVSSGNSIFGNMTKTGPTSWYISGIVNGANTYLNVNDARLNTQPWAYCTLEVYGIVDCSTDFPPASSPMLFTQLQLFDQGGKPVTPVWQALNNGADHCNATATVNSAAATTITF